MEFYQSIDTIYLIWRVLPAWKMPLFLTACPEFYFQYVDKKYLTINYNDEKRFYQLEDEVDWPGYTSLINNTFTLMLRKVDARNWTNPLVHGPPAVGNLYMWQKHFEVTVKRKVMLSDTMCVVTMKHIDPVYTYVGPGRYINLVPARQDKQSKYPFYVLPTIPTEKLGNYTVPNFDVEGDAPMEATFSVLSIVRKNKTTPERLCKVNNGDNMWVTKPKGKFCLSVADHNEIIVIIAEKFGIIPALSVTIEVLIKKKDKKIRLLYIDESDLEMIMTKEVEMIAKYETRFTYQYLVSNPTSNYKGEVGNFSGEVFTRFIDEPCARTNHFYLVCGQSPFIFHASKMIVKEYACNKNQIFRIMI